MSTAKNKLTIGFVLNGTEHQFTTVVDAWRDEENAARELRLKLMAEILDLETWVVERKIETR